MHHEKVNIKERNRVTAALTVKPSIMIKYRKLVEHTKEKEKTEVEFGTQKIIELEYKKFKKKIKTKFLKFFTRESRNKEMTYFAVVAIYIIGGIALSIINPWSIIVTPFTFVVINAIYWYFDEQRLNKGQGSVL